MFSFCATHCCDTTECCSATEGTQKNQMTQDSGGQERSFSPPLPPTHTTRALREAQHKGACTVHHPHHNIFFATQMLHEWQLLQSHRLGQGPRVGPAQGRGCGDRDRSRGPGALSGWSVRDRQAPGCPGEAKASWGPRMCGGQWASPPCLLPCCSSGRPSGGWRPASAWRHCAPLPPRGQSGLWQERTQLQFRLDSSLAGDMVITDITRVWELGIVCK